AHWIRPNPPRASFASGKGPSVTIVFPSLTRTERARRGGASWLPVTHAPRARSSSSHGKLSSSASPLSVAAGSLWASIPSVSQQTSSRYFIVVLPASSRSRPTRTTDARCGLRHSVAPLREGLRRHVGDHEKE